MWKNMCFFNYLPLIGAFNCAVSYLSVCNLTIALNLPLLLMCGLFKEGWERDIHNELQSSRC